MKNQALFSSKGKSKKNVWSALRVNPQSDCHLHYCTFSELLRTDIVRNA